MFFVEDIRWGNKLRKGLCPKSHSQEVADYRFQFGPGTLEPSFTMVPAASEQGSLCTSPDLLIIDEAHIPQPPGSWLQASVSFMRWASPQNLLESHQ